MNLQAHDNKAERKAEGKGVINATEGEKEIKNSPKRKLKSRKQEDEQGPVSVKNPITII